MSSSRRFQAIKEHSKKWISKNWFIFLIGIFIGMIIKWILIVLLMIGIVYGIYKLKIDKEEVKKSLIEREDYEKYLLDKIKGYKKILDKSFSGTSRVREVLEFELQQFELRLFNFRKGYQSAKAQTIKEIEKVKTKTTKEILESIGAKEYFDIQQDFDNSEIPIEESIDKQRLDSWCATWNDEWVKLRDLKQKIKELGGENGEKKRV